MEDKTNRTDYWRCAIRTLGESLGLKTTRFVRVNALFQVSRQISGFCQLLSNVYGGSCDGCGEGHEHQGLLFSVAIQHYNILIFSMVYTAKVSRCLKCML